jgi:hypothetical protein
MSERWVDELMPDEPKWVRDLVDEELAKRGADYDAKCAEVGRLRGLLAEVERDFAARMEKALQVNEQRLDELSDCKARLAEARA